jgi:hypothetical protein
MAIPIIRDWRLVFLDGVPDEQRGQALDQVIRIAREGTVNGQTIELRPRYSVSGHIYNGDFPDGRIFITHLVTGLRRVTDTALAKSIAKDGEKVLMIETDHNESFYLVVDKINFVYHK